VRLRGRGQRTPCWTRGTRPPSPACSPSPLLPARAPPGAWPTPLHPPPLRGPRKLPGTAAAVRWAIAGMTILTASATAPESFYPLPLRLPPYQGLQVHPQQLPEIPCLGDRDGVSAPALARLACACSTAACRALAASSAAPTPDHLPVQPPAPRGPVPELLGQCIRPARTSGCTGRTPPGKRQAEEAGEEARGPERAKGPQRGCTRGGPRGYWRWRRRCRASRRAEGRRREGLRVGRVC